MAKVLQADIITGTYVPIGCDAGKTKGLSWHILETMVDHLQELVILLAKYELETDESPNLKNYELELFDFKPGSAVPAFRLIPREKELFPKEEKQKTIIAKKFDSLLTIANNGSYDSILKEYNLEEVRTEIATELYGFTISAGNSPLSIVYPENGGFRSIYKISKFRKEQVDTLIKPFRKKQKAELPSLEVFGKILVPTTGRSYRRRKIVELYQGKDTTLSIAPTQIVAPNKTYNLHNPLLCQVEKEDDYFIIQAPLYDLYAAGPTIDEAEINFYEEFDSTFNRFNEIPDESLSDRLLRAKQAINLIVKNIIEE